MAEAEHKLKTRLTVIGGWATLLDEGWADIHDVDKLTGIRAIREHADGLKRDTERMLEELRAEIATAELDPRTMDLAPLLRLSRRDWERSERHAITVHCSDDVTVIADPGALTQILGHLLENAVKYSPAGGAIELAAEHVTDAADGSTAVIRVTDHGLGVPDDVDVFAPFQRGHATAARIEGTGIGLYIVRKLTEAMGGTETVELNPKGGSSFAVRLPAPSRAAAR